MFSMCLFVVNWLRHLHMFGLCSPFVDFIEFSSSDFSRKLSTDSFSRVSFLEDVWREVERQIVGSNVVVTVRCFKVSCWMIILQG